MLTSPASQVIARQENHADTILARFRQIDADTRADRPEHPVGQLQQDAGAIAGIVLAARTAAVGEIGQDGDGVPNDRVRFFTANIDDETDAAGIVLVLRIVQSLLGRLTGETCFHVRSSWPSITRLADNWMPAA